MPYSYHESTHISHENAVALKSLTATGELPKDHYWNALREKHDANPTRFDKGNYVLAALLDRDQLQRQGVLSANAPILPTGGFFAYAGGKHSLDIARFDHWHPFLGRLFEITLPNTTTGQAVNPAPQTPQNPSSLNPIPTTPTPTLPVTVLTPGSTGGGGTNPLGPATQLLPPAGTIITTPGSTGGGGINVIGPNVVPEPASVVLLGLALLVAVAGSFVARKGRRGSVAGAA